MSDEKIVCYVLMSGQEIIAKQLPSDTEGQIRLSKPRVVQLQAMAGGQIGIALFPLSVNSVEEDFILNNSAILGAPVKILDSLEKRYIEETTRIVLAK